MRGNTDVRITSFYVLSNPAPYGAVDFYSAVFIEFL